MATGAATATVATKPTKQPKPLPVPNSDFYEVYETLNPEELATVKRVRTFMETKVAPVITKYRRRQHERGFGQTLQLRGCRRLRDEDMKRKCG